MTIAERSCCALESIAVALQDLKDQLEELNTTLANIEYNTEVNKREGNQR